MPPPANSRWTRILKDLSFTKSQIYTKINKPAFTLAEVLITLGIVGLVIAILLPTIIMNYKKIVWVNQLKSNYTILSNAFSQMTNSAGTTSLAESEAFLSINGAGIGINTPINDVNSINFFKKFIKGNLIKPDNYSYKKMIIHLCNLYIIQVVQEE